MALTKTQVSELYVSIFNRASEKSGSQNWLNSGFNTDATAMANEMLATGAAKEYFGTSLDSDAAFVEHIYANTLNKGGADVDAEGKAGWVEFLTNHTRGEMVVKMIEAIKEYEVGGSKYADADQATKDAAKQFANRVEVSDYTADTLETIAVSEIDSTLSFSGALTVTADPDTVTTAKKEIDTLKPNPGQPFMLTEGRDNITGTSGDDTIYGDVGQNQNGALSNGFSTGDVINGEAGRDTLIASVMGDRTVDEGGVVTIHARTTNLEVAKFEVINDGAVTIDAGRMDSVEEFWSVNSSGNLTVTDVRLGSKLDITKQLTFGLESVDYNTDFTARLDSQAFQKAGAVKANSALSVQIADVSTETPATPLENVNMDLGFSLDGVAYTLEDIQADGGTYAGLITAIQTALAAEGLNGLTVKAGASYENVTVAGNTVKLPFTATEVIITDSAGKVFTDVSFQQNAIAPVAGGFLVAGTAAPLDPTETSTMIETNVILDDAGRGSTAGTVEIGGMSNSDKGIEKFNVMVDRDSKIAELTETNNKLKEIEITSLDAKGSLTINKIDDELSLVSAGNFKGESLTIGQTGANSVSNLTSFNSAGSNTNVTLVADYDGSVRASDAQSFTINTGSGNDTITADVIGTSTSGSTTANLTVVSAGGDNTITLSSTTAEINKANVTTGSGKDTVTGGATHLTASTGAGNDVIYAENTGDKASVTFAAGAFSGTASPAPLATMNNSQFLNGKEITITVAMPEETTAGVTEAVAYTDGYEIVFDFKSAKELSTEVEFYNAIAAQINADTVVNKLVKASVDSNGALKVEYKVDGSTVNGEQLVAIKISDDDIATTDVSDAFLKAVRTEVSDSTITKSDIIAAYNQNVTAVTAATTGGTLASLTFDLTGLADNEDIIINIDGATVTLLTGGGTIEADHAGSQVTIGGTTYDITSGAADNLVLTATSYVDLDLTAASITDETGTVVNATVVDGVQGTNGTDSTTNGVNSVNGGTGDDVIVLSSNDSYIDTVVFDAGSIGNDTIVHFNSAAGGDKLDFTAFLTGKSSATGSVESQKTIATTLNGDANVEANSVTKLSYTVDATDTWDLLTGATLKAAINSTNVGSADDFSNLGAATLNALNTYTNTSTGATLVGGTGHAIVMIENAGNLGEYKIFELTFDGTASNTTADFTNVTLIGSVDFGESLATGATGFDATNLA